MSDYKAIISAINSILNDITLERIRNFTAENPIEIAKQLGASRKSVKLMELLEVNHPSLGRKFVRFGYSTGQINYFLLAKWLMLRARVVGAEMAYQSVLSLESSDVVHGYTVTLIRGLEFYGAIDFYNGIKLVDYQNLPSTILENLAVKINPERERLYPPYTYLIQPLSNNFFDADYPFVDDHLKLYSESELLIVNYLSLFTDAFAPTVDRRWYVLNDEVPMSGICDYQSICYLEMEPPKIHFNLNSVAKEEIESTFIKYIEIPTDLKLPIDISISRIVKAMNTWNNVNKAIDLGVALEAAFIHEESKLKKSQQVRNTGAHLVKVFEGYKVKSLLYTIYGIRSDAVHRGKVLNEYKVDNVGFKPVSILLDLGVNVLKHCIIGIIKRNGVVPKVTNNPDI
ncbi:hypothetical protein [Shewanella mangrovisoli]|uniref:Apea-like HEPN domain-containing protein n=1 Tax=Shewanella mangrovisoli TaxID=2864211 RepID=A0ABV4VI22_9GAMM